MRHASWDGWRCSHAARLAWGCGDAASPDCRLAAGIASACARFLASVSTVDASGGCDDIGIRIGAGIGIGIGDAGGGGAAGTSATGGGISAGSGAAG